MRDVTTIERLTVNAVDTAITRCSRLSCEFNKNDKTPSWDGCIYIHKNANKGKEGLAKISVQIKGTECESFSENEVSFSAEIEDLKNYLHNGGVVFFVVELNLQADTKIFYQTLLPIKLKSILEGTDDNQKTKTIHLKPLPDDNNAVETIIVNFYQDAHKQTSFAETDLLTLADLFNNPNVEKITMSTTKCGAKDGELDSFKPFFENELCAYVQMKGSRSLEPIKETIKTKEIRQKLFQPISSQGRQFYDSYTQTLTEDCIKYKFGSVFEMVSTDEGNKGKLNYSFGAKTLSVKYQALLFIKSAIESRSFTIGDKVYNLGDDNPFGELDYDTQIEGCERLSQLLTALHVTQDLELSSLTESDYNSIAVVADSILENRPVSGVSFKQELPTVVNLKLGNLRLKFVASKQEGSDDVLFEDFFTSQHLFYIHTEEGEKAAFPTVPAAVLTVEELSTVSNMNPGFVMSQLDIPALHNSFSFTMVNELLNKTLRAYDVCHRPQLLDFADNLAQWLLDKDVPYVSPYGKQLDILQITRRRRKLTKAENEQLKGYLSNDSFDQMDLIGIYLLLNKKKDAKSVYKLMDETTKDAFNESPLHLFWK